MKRLTLSLGLLAAGLLLSACCCPYYPACDCPARDTFDSNGKIK